MSFHHKYLKYKTKYLNLKYGGGKLDQSEISTFIYTNDDIEIIKSLIDNSSDLTIEKSKINVVKWIDENTLTSQVFPGENEHTPAWSKKNRPFRVCPINYKDLKKKSNEAKFNICVFQNDKLIGFSIIYLLETNYKIEIICTKQGLGVGSYIISIIKIITGNLPIQLDSVSDAVDFYKLQGFTIVKKLLDTTGLRSSDTTKMIYTK